MENLWTLMDSLMTKLKVTVRAESELGKKVCKKGKKVFVDVNFENNSIQVKKRMNTDEVLPILDALVSSFEYPAPRHCAQLRLVSRVRDDSTRKQLDKMLNGFLKKKSNETSPTAAAGTGDNISSEHQESESLLLHAFDDQWHESSKIVLKTPKVGRAGKKEKKTYFRYKETTKELFAQLYKIFTDAAQGSDFLRWLEDVNVEYGKKKKRLHSLMECRFPFLLDKRCHMYFHGQWLSFHPDFHSHLEVHFLELLKTRSIEPNLILPLPWLQSEMQKKKNGGVGGKAGGGGPRGEQGEAGWGKEKEKKEKQFARFLAAWLERNDPTEETSKELQGKEPYKKLVECLRSCDIKEPEYNEMFALVDQLMGNPKDRGFIVGDGVTLQGLELFDLLYYDEKRVFFIHVKKGFSAKNMRMVVDQVRQSAEFLQCLIFRGREACEEELETFIKQLKNCPKEGECPRHKDRKWACDANDVCTKELNASKFAELLNSREKHFVLAYGGTRMLKSELDVITGRKVDDVLKKHEKWVERLASKGYVKRAGATKKSPNYALTSRFCVETEENFAKCITNDEEEMTDQDLLVMFRDLKGAISTTETSAGKMAFLNLFGSFSNYQNMTLHFCRIDHQFPTNEAIEEYITTLENSTHTSG